MKSKPTRTLFIEVEFVSDQDLKASLSHVRQSIREDNMKHEDFIRGHRVKFETKDLTINDVKINADSEIISINQKYRFETINGESCVVYQSKMNEL